MPSKSNTDTLFQLIKSLEKAEKRNFKLFITRSSGKEDLKVVQLFDAIDKLTDYDDKVLLKKLKTVEKPQLANLKAHLYKQIMGSLRVLKSTESVELQMNELLDYARILYNKGLFQQSLKMLERARELARANQKYNFLSQVTSLEKKIETLHITRRSLEKSTALAEEAIEVSNHISTVSVLSNLALRMYVLYVTNGHARNEKEESVIKKIFKENLPEGAYAQTGFYERLYFYQAKVWYAFIRQDFLMYYRYSQKWVDLFNEDPRMQKVETGHYIKSMHNLLNAHFDLRNYKQFNKTLQEFEEFAGTPYAQQHDNFKIYCFVYIISAKVNQHLITGTFKEGLKLVPYIEEQLEEYGLSIDSHRVLVLNYKIAMLYFGSGDFNTSIDYLHKIINDHVDLRYDIQCYARLVHLMCHFELGNDQIIEYLIKSVYRFMAKMENLTVVEEEIFKFLRHSFNVSPRKMKPELENLLSKIKKFETNRFETRAFAYLDIISYVEGKVSGKPMSEVIYEKYQQSKHR